MIITLLGKSKWGGMKDWIDYVKMYDSVNKTYKDIQRDGKEVQDE